MVIQNASPNEDEPLGWYSRGYHPHLDDPQRLQSIGFRLADSVPNHLLERWREEARQTGDPGDQVRAANLDRLIGRFEDAGHGACHLRHPRIAGLVQDTLLYGDGDRYRLIDWCIMPNHVHGLIEPHRASLRRIVQTWKSVSARRANLILGRKGRFWMEDYYDRYIRDRRHYEAVRRYIWNNPVTAGLCRRADQWPWSSARLRVGELVGE
ncbi:MAG: transposase [Acidobacteria bacterium]|nr:transposase [Acidobacteriota bacterium]